MKVQITVKLEPENKQEALDYQKHYRNIRENFENLTKQWQIEQPRFLLITKRFE